VHMVPDLAGRVVRILDKRSGRELLFQPDPSAKQYPNLGGLTVAPYPDYVARSPWAARWTLSPGGTATETALDGSCDNGLRMRRRLWLEGSTLRTRTVLENTRAEPIDALLQSRWEVDPGPLDAASLSYRTQAGARRETPFIQLERQPSGTESFEGADQPDGEWTITTRAGGLVTVNRFAKEQVARCLLNWTAKGENRVGLTVASERRTLKQNESLILDADYGVR